MPRRPLSATVSVRRSRSRLRCPCVVRSPRCRSAPVASAASYRRWTRPGPDRELEGRDDRLRAAWMSGRRTSAYRQQPVASRHVAPVNLYSDTQTRPTEGMRAAIAAAEVGDEQRGADPTTRTLERLVAALLGHEAAVFLPSGTMCNEIALRLHVRPGGDEVILHSSAHPVIAEAGGPAQLAGAMLRTLEGDGGMFSAEQLE